MSEGYLYRSPGADRALVEHVEFCFARDQWHPEFDDSWEQNSRRTFALKMLALRAALLRGLPSAQQVWERHRVAVMKIWPKELPGTRPLCWWAFDSPLRRLPIANPMEAGLFRFDSGWESQANYLNRNGLLSALERTKLPAAAYEPAPLTVVGETNDRG